MLRIFIVDDDSTILDGLKAIIKNNASDCVVIGEALNGLAALKDIQNLQPDLIITDIKMPGLSGIELIKTLKNQGLKIRIIVLSGFDEYNYVRDSLKNGAMDYLLKPVQNRDLLELLEKVKQKINEEKNEAEKAKYISERIETSTDVLNEKYLMELVKGNYENALKYRDKLNESAIFKANKYMLSIVEADDLYRLNERYPAIIDESTIASMLFKVFDGILQEEMLKELSIIKAPVKCGIILLFSVKDQNVNDFENMIYMLLNNYRCAMTEHASFTVTVGVSEIFDNYKRTHIAFVQAKYALERRFYEGKNRVIPYQSQNCIYNKIKANDFDQDITEIINSIEIGDSIKTGKAAIKFLENIKNRNLSPVEFRDILTGAVHKISSLSLEFKNANDIYTDEEQNLFFYINRLDTLIEMKDFIKDKLSALSQLVNQIRSGRSKRVIEIAKDFICKNYQNDVSLSFISEYVNLSPNYFCDLFKNETGIKFSEYVMDVRVKEAKRLLSKTDLKIYEVGSKVGYGEVVSFVRAFKKVVGITPAEYRNVVK